MPGLCIAFTIIWGVGAALGMLLFSVAYFIGDYPGQRPPADKHSSHYNFSKFFWAFMWNLAWPLTAILEHLHHIYKYSLDE